MKAYAWTMSAFWALAIVGMAGSPTASPLQTILGVCALVWSIRTAIKSNQVYGG